MVLLNEDNSIYIPLIFSFSIIGRRMLTQQYVPVAVLINWLTTLIEK